ncbi:MAG: polymer-forming cytoskeletal protein [Lachnospiraceae bacterium]|nr:polymer-forming cytoskeletal protein [Lachnospiraceae bacterium]MCI9657446.1 polymer-forming cytoskeletal protein [Lachnospiraceae bacterium]
MLGKSRKETPVATETPGKISTIIGPGAVFNGNLNAPETIRIDGTINGNCVCEQSLILGTEGRIKGNITAQNVMISGRVDGDLIVREKLEVLSSGKVIGNVTTKSLIVDDGGCFDGRCTMTDQTSSSSPYHAQGEPALQLDSLSASGDTSDESAS